ncbi:MAG TPA: ferrous iron transporter B [Phycisphaerales bacterium]|nr:ferrous iron transporter B [Phycisphaerales bacterium]
MADKPQPTLTVLGTPPPRGGSSESPECAWCDPAQRCDPADACHTGETARRIALLGNPNTGKTTLFNRLSGLRHKTSNFPGTTLEARVTRVKRGVEGGRDGDLIDLPGIYSLELDQLESRICREVLAGTAAPRGEPLGEPECAVVVVDAANLARNLMLVGEVFRRRLPTVLVVNMIDVALRHGVRIDARALEAAIGCGVVLTNAREGTGIDDLRHAIRNARIPTPFRAVPAGGDELRAWADEMNLHGARAARGPGTGTLSETGSDRVDRLLLHPIGGTLVFALVMAGLFYSIFSLARYPMDWLGFIFEWAKGFVHSWMGTGALANLLADGIVGGVGSVLIFLPQICLLFFIISLLEDTGYLARGAFLMDRLLRPFGLPGHAFVPLLSSHACALPGIMATRAIPDQRERLATILVAPFMTCSARLPVYVLLTSLLFKDRPLMAALAFVGCYLLGMVAAVLSALIARRTILKGKSRAMAMELPTYKRPSLRTAFVGTFDRARLFVRNAGTNILVICVVLWWLGAYPRVTPPPEVSTIRNAISGTTVPNADVYIPPGPVADALATKSLSSLRGVVLVSRDTAIAEADRLEARHQKTHSFLGTIGRGIEPVFRPLGFDWQLTIGVLASFAAREVFVSTMNVVIAGQETPQDDAAKANLMLQIQEAKRSDGVTPIFTPAASWSLLVFFVLAMQCLPTLAVTARESGHVKWALLQLVWMTGVAYVAAAIVYQVMR